MAHRKSGIKKEEGTKKLGEEDKTETVWAGRHKWTTLAVAVLLVTSSLAFYLFVIESPEPPDPPLTFEITFPEDEGVHQGHMMEAWTFGGFLEDANGRTFGYQVRYWANGRRDVVFTDELNVTGKTFYSDVNLPTSEVDPSLNIQIGNESLDITYKNGYVNDRWIETDTDNFTYVLGSVLFEGTDELLVLNLTSQSNKDPLLLGNNGKIYLQEYGTIYVYQQSNVSVSGSMVLNGIPFSVTGFARIDHAWGAWSLASMEVWNIALSNGRELLITRLFEGDLVFIEYVYTIESDGSYDVVLYSDVYPLAPGFTYEEFEAQNLSIQIQRYWLDPIDSTQTRCFSHGWRLVSERFQYNLSIEPTVANQRTGGSWDGTADVAGTFNDLHVTGKCYVNLIKMYRSTLAIDNVMNNSDYIMTYELPNDPVEVSADITDDIPITEVTLFYRVDNGTNQSLSMERDNQTWSADIPGQNMDRVVEFWLVARDAAEKVVKTETYGYLVRIQV